MGEAVLSAPGGCELGPRPIDLHLASIRALGGTVDETGGALRCTGNHMAGTDIVLSIPSVGATENTMLAAVAAQGSPPSPTLPVSRRLWISRPSCVPWARTCGGLAAP